MARRGTSPLPWILGGLLVIAGGVAVGLMLSEDGAPDDSGRRTVIERTTPDDEPLAEIAPVEPAPDRPEPRGPAAPRTKVLRTGVVRGRVVDIHHTAVVGAQITALEGGLVSGFVATPELKPLGQRTESGADGSFELGEVPVTSNLVLRVDGVDFQVTDAGNFNVRPNKPTDVGVIVVTPGARIRGVVLSPEGHRLPGAQVAFHLDLPLDAKGQPGRAERVSLTDEDGEFRLDHVSRGTFLLFVQADGFANQLVRGNPSPELSETSLSIQMLAATPLVGTVVTKPGKAPVEGARLIARPIGRGGSMSTTLSDAEGRFEFTDVAADNYQVSCTADGHSALSERTWRDRFDQPLEFKLPKRGSLEGQIVGDDERPIQRFDLRVRHSARRSGASIAVGGYRRISHSEGLFTVEDLEPGFYTFEVWSKGYALTLSEPVQVTQGARVTGLIMPLERGASLDGVVVDDLGAPVAGATVSLHPNREPDAAFLRGTMGKQAWLKDTTTDAAGRFLLEDLTSLAYQVQVEHPIHSTLRINDVVAETGKSKDLGELVIDRAATVRGVAEDDKGVPVPKQTVHLINYAGRTSRTTTTNSRGEFVFDRVGGGEYAVRAYAEGLNLGESLRLAANEVGATVNANEYTVIRFNVLPGEELTRNVYVLR